MVGPVGRYVLEPNMVRRWFWKRKVSKLILFMDNMWAILKKLLRENTPENFNESFAWIFIRV